MFKIPKVHNSEINEFIKTAEKMADDVSDELIRNFRKDKPVERGTVKDVRIVYDRTSDRIIREILSNKFPGHSILTEENGLTEKDSEIIWIIDPLDGTGNYASQNPLFSVSIAVWKNGIPLIGIIDAPMMQERFIAIKNSGAFHIDYLRKKLNIAHVSDIRNKSDAYGVYCEGGVKIKNKSLELLNNYYRQLKDVRKLGSAALELAFVGTGRSESYMTTEISIWDIAAGILFVHEAGGAITHFNGTPYKWDEFTPDSVFDLLATNGKVDITIS